LDWRFHKLPARPLVRHDLHVDGLEAGQVESAIRSLVASAPVDAVLSIRVSGSISDEVGRVLSARFLRSVAPETMNLDLRLDVDAGAPRRSAPQTDDLSDLPLWA